MMAKPFPLPSPGPGLRVETGVIQFEGDWPGIFIRGDEALGFAARLTAVLRGDANHDATQQVFELCRLLIKAHSKPRLRREMASRLRDAEEQHLHARHASEERFIRNAAKLAEMRKP